MSLSNPERIVTKQDLKDFYEGIFPYLGGNVEAGFTPIGTIIAVMGNSAPTNYLACNGQVVNIADYPELANYFLAQFGSRSKFGGNGTTTFGIPDLRGEFLRGTGTNSHSNQGNGADVGTHQDATEVPYTLIKGSSKQLLYRGDTQTNIQLVNSDKTYKRGAGTTTLQYVSGTTDSASPGNVDAYSVRPTNTSVLYCIATKNIYMNPSLSYTEEEQVVGSWIDGKPIYQRVFTGTMPSTIPTTRTSISVATIPNLERAVSCTGMIETTYNSERGCLTFPFSNLNLNTSTNAWTGGYVISTYVEKTSGVVTLSIIGDSGFIVASQPYYVTVRYTKTTD